MFQPIEPTRTIPGTEAPRREDVEARMVLPTTMIEMQTMGATHSLVVDMHGDRAYYFVTPIGGPVGGTVPDPVQVWEGIDGTVEAMRAVAWVYAAAVGEVMHELA